MRKITIYLSIVCLSICLSIAALSSAQEKEVSKEQLALKGLTLIDGKGGDPVSDVTLIIENKQIADIIVKGSKSIPNKAKEIDLKGCYVIPGLIDSHVHLATDPSGTENRKHSEAYLRQMLYGGVTSVRDMAGDTRALADLARDANLDEIESPNIYYASLMAGPSFFMDKRTHTSANGEIAGYVPWMKAITSDTDIRLAVASAKGTGATGIKIYANLPATEVRRITEEAHRQDMKVWAHATVFPARPSEVVDAGVDVVSHVSFLAWETFETVPESYPGRKLDFSSISIKNPSFARIFKRMVEQNVILDDTVDIEKSEEPRRENQTTVRQEFAYALVKAAHEAGVLIAAGTDDVNDLKTEPFPPLHKEMELLATKCGLTPIEVITSSSLIGAKAIGIEGRCGTIDVGKAANLVVLDTNPITDIRNIGKIRFVMKNGKIYERKAYKMPVEK